ncbi:putative iron-regulated protein [Tenacibaculum adriaticum]|uniref:Putative iron-regulated protein n=1 Tax=Tenacibaculum adriaticum TaxID=413713 RepID=A0A5S5E0D9_9FLAO|nr:ChaN family lipoprotein [Tenacibaculum adriaticum]TYQ00463.1 putative iron-regulated protein [Tenacibaculum adriaticum]
MKKSIFILFLLFISNYTFSQKKAYVIYNSKGKKVSYKKMIRVLSKNNIVLFGELHNNPISHWLQYEVTEDLNKQRQLILGAEMFEADNQNELNDYLKGTINSKALDSLARLWPNYKTDYAPLVNFAKKNKLPFVATNIPRRYANKVYKKGFEVLDSLSLEEKTWIAPLPITFDSELPTYKNILKMMGDHGSPKLVMAQAIKDATMAHFILKNYKSNYLSIHYNGAYHSDNYEGILWYLKKERNDLKYVTITTILQKNVDKLLEENHKKADFIICVDNNMTTTY